MLISKDSVVSVNYTLKNEEGKTLDSSDQGGPLVYLHGAQNVIPGLENALEGKKPGDKFSISISPDDAYGSRDENMIQSIPREQFPDSENVRAGMAFQMESPQGPMVIHVTEVNEAEVVVDANHPLAGVTLFFDVEVADVRAATEEEIAHGHVHGPGGHHH